MSSGVIDSESSRYFLSVVIPAYDEEMRLRTSLPVLRDYLRNQDYLWEVIVVDDGSSDRTSKIPMEIFSESETVRVLENPGNRGKGYSVKQGLLAANGELILVTDADFSTPIEEFEKLRACLKEGWDVAIGSRSLKDSDVQISQPWYREGMGRIFNVFVQMTVLRGFIDTQCGFKISNGNLARKIYGESVIDGFLFDIEFLKKAKKNAVTIYELPIHWTCDRDSRLSLLPTLWEVLRDALRLIIH